eukprot:3948183-Pleurochrysis_carterae.AAC.1
MSPLELKSLFRSIDPVYLSIMPAATLQDVKREMEKVRALFRPRYVSRLARQSSKAGRVSPFALVRLHLDNLVFLNNSGPTLSMHGRTGQLIT